MSRSSRDDGGGPKKRLRVSMDSEVRLTAEQLSVTPSMKDGISRETETDLRTWGCELIQHAGLILKSHQVVMACGQVLLQRFYYRKSLLWYSVQDVATACIFLAGKIEEDQKRLQKIMAVVNHVTQSCSQACENGEKRPKFLEPGTNVYFRTKDKVIQAERLILKELGFNVHTKHSHKLVVTYCTLIGVDSINKECVNLAWNYMNDGHRTDVFVRYPAETIACACVHLATIKLEIAMPEWWSVFGATTADINAIGGAIMAMYERPKRYYEDMRMELREIIMAKEVEKRAADTARREAKARERAEKQKQLREAAKSITSSPSSSSGGASGGASGASSSQGSSPVTAISEAGRVKAEAKAKNLASRQAAFGIKSAFSSTLAKVPSPLRSNLSGGGGTAAATAAQKARALFAAKANAIAAAKESKGKVGGGVAASARAAAAGGGGAAATAPAADGTSSNGAGGRGETTATAVIATDGMIETETETDGRAAAVAGVVTEVVVLLHVDDQDPGPLVAAAVGKGGDGDAFDN
eukprot:gene6022-12893_t